MADPPPRPLVGLPVTTAAPVPQPPRHETVLPPEPPAALAALTAALAAASGSERHAALAAVAGHHPTLLEAWSRLSELALADGDPVTAYAYARVAYHRGLDRLRKHGWGGTGLVHWAQPENRGFLRGVHALLAAAAALDEAEEAERCRAFLLELDPDDPLGVAGYPAIPGPGWAAPQLP